MVKLTQSLEHWMFVNHPDILPLLLFGHVELFTDEMQAQYIEWVQTEEGRQYLKGGSKYKEEADEPKTENEENETGAGVV